MFCSMVTAIIMLLTDWLHTSEMIPDNRTNVAYKSEMLYTLTWIQCTKTRLWLCQLTDTLCALQRGRWKCWTWKWRTKWQDMKLSGIFVSCNFPSCCNLMCCNFMSWKLVRHFHVQHFQSTLAMQRPLVQVCSLPGIRRRSLRSTGTNRFLVPPVKRSTVGSRAFPVAGPKTWNSLPEDITSSQSEYTFRRQLKAWFFKKSFPDWCDMYNAMIMIYSPCWYIAYRSPVLPN